MIQQFLSRLSLVLLLATPFLTLAPVYAEASTTDMAAGCLPGDVYNHVTGAPCASPSVPTAPAVAGCLPGDLYSHVSGEKCPVQAATIPGCIPGALFSYMTGQRCVAEAAPAIPGCSATSAYSYITGQKCSTVTATVTTTTTTTVSVDPLSDQIPVTLTAAPIALLAGGTTGPGTTVPISYLQLNNASNGTTTIKGFWVVENGTAPVNAIIGFSSVDDKGNYRSAIGGTEGQTPFVDGRAFVPSGAVISPHQMKLFTIKAQLSANASQYAGTNLMLDVAGIDTKATFSTAFPIRGTTWTISN